MSRPPADPPLAETILHPTDFSAGSEKAFAHALALACHQGSSLTILHAGEQDREKRWSEFPSVRETLARWSLLNGPGDRASVYRDLDVRVKKVSLRKPHAVPAVLEYLDEHPIDLIVLATEGREGVPRWMRPSMAEAIARRSRTLTLFVPSRANGFVSDNEGRIDLRSILVPVDRRPDPDGAVWRAARVAALSVSTPVEVVLLHVGASPIPETQYPAYPSCTCSRVTKPGDVVEGILQTADERAAGLIVMPTEGRHGVLDAFRGSVTEQVLRRAPCPVLAVPA